MPGTTPEQYRHMLEAAIAHAYPALNVTSMIIANAALRQEVLRHFAGVHRRGRLRFGFVPATAL